MNIHCNSFIGIQALDHLLKQIEFPEFPQTLVCMDKKLPVMHKNVCSWHAMCTLLIAFIDSPFGGNSLRSSVNPPPLHPQQSPNTNMIYKR